MFIRVVKHPGRGGGGGLYRDLPQDGWDAKGCLR